MVLAGNKAKRLSSVNDTAKTIHHSFIIIKYPKRSSKVSGFGELALERSHLQNVADNRKYRKNVENDQAENILMKNMIWRRVLLTLE